MERTPPRSVPSGSTSSLASPVLDTVRSVLGTIRGTVTKPEKEQHQHQRHINTKNSLVQATIMALASTVTDVPGDDVPSVIPRCHPALISQVVSIHNSGITNLSPVIIHSTPQRILMKEKGPACNGNGGAPVGCKMLRLIFTSRRMGRITHPAPIRMVYDRGKCFTGISSSSRYTTCIGTACQHGSDALFDADCAHVSIWL